MGVYRQSPGRAVLSAVIRGMSTALNLVLPKDAIPLSAVEVVRVTATLPRLDRAFDGYRIVQVSDFHMGTWMNVERLVHAIELVNDLKPDLIAITGDFIAYEVEKPLRAMAGPLRQLRARDGVFAVLGNHDYYQNKPEAVRAVLRDCGIVELRNDVHSLHRGAATLILAGLDDGYYNQPHLEQLLPRVPEHGAVILLAHEPDLADQTAATGRFDLQLSGHTHGGQVILPVLGTLYLPHLGKKYPSGMYQVNGLQVYTNRGLGTSHLQLRVNCPPEITEFTLRGQF